MTTKKVDGNNFNGIESDYVGGNGDKNEKRKMKGK